MKSNQGGSDETRIDELDFFGTLAQPYGKFVVLQMFFKRSVMIIQCHSRSQRLAKTGGIVIRKEVHVVNRAAQVYLDLSLISGHVCPT